jgi:conjugal transfer/type IV secretion protein DotA/TraY
VFGFRHNRSVICGEITFHCKVSDKYGDAAGPGSRLCAAQAYATRALAQRLEPIVDTLYKGDEGTTPDAAAMQEALDAYHNTFRDIASQDPQITYDEAKGGWSLDLSKSESGVNKVKNFADEARSQGWLMAGQWYWLMSASTFEQQMLSRPQIEVKGYDMEKLTNYEQDYLPLVGRLKTTLSNASFNFDGDDKTPPQSISPNMGDNAMTSGSAEDGAGVIGQWWNQAGGSRLHAWHEKLLKDEDPIRTLASYGQMMIGTGWTLWGAAIAAKALSDTAEKLTGGGDGGNGGAIGAVTGFFSSIVGSVFSMVMVGVAFLIGTGAFLAYYLPAVPFIFWIMAILGWVIMVAQSLLAAPLWAASHAVPEGDGFAGRYALQGWQLMLDVITRPILLTLGLLISMFVMHAIVYFALKGYAVFNASVVSSTATIAITGIIVTNLIMTSIVIVLAHKSHELMHDLADDIAAPRKTCCAARLLRRVLARSSSIRSICLVARCAAPCTRAAHDGFSRCPS